MKLKVCGINDKNILQSIIKLDVDYVGFIFFEKSPRCVNLDFIREISVFDFKNTIPVCVFVNSNNSFIREVISFFEKPIIQFHGDETQIFCDSFDTHYWKAIRISNQESFKQITSYPNAKGILLDTFEDKNYGGTGRAFDWSFLKTNNFAQNLILSGGINDQNMQEACKLSPWCIDINSGVELAPGKKDLVKINKIIKIKHNYEQQRLT